MQIKINAIERKRNILEVKDNGGVIQTQSSQITI